jgi:type II secretory pathway component GspD/PulD (secretin)
MAALLVGFAWLLSAQDTTPAGFQAYRLRHAPAGEIVPQLDSMLSGEGTRYEIIVDRNGNRILVQGGEVTQSLAGQLIEALDQPVASRPAGAKPAAPAIVRNYSVAESQLTETLAEMRRKFPPQTGARIAADTRSSQLLVVAPEEIQQRIAQSLRPVAAAQAATVAGPPAATSRSSTLQSISSRELEDRLTRLWGQRLSRAATNDGDVAVLSLSTDAGLQPVLQLDRRRDSVSFLGGPDSIQLWQRVVQALDCSPRAGEPQTDLIPLDRADPRKVQRAVALLETGGLPHRTPTARLTSTFVQQDGPAGESAPAAQPGAPARETTGGEAAAAGEGPTMLAEEGGGLIGPVQIEFLEGLDVIVIRGNKRDVERVRKIIAEIETFSAETQPSIEILHLNHVGSQVLADLVTTIYNEILSPRQGQVTIRALVKPNALLMIGRPESVNTVKDLIEKLDQPTKPETEFQVFPLKHISAVDAQTTVQNFFVDRLGQTQQLGAQATSGTSRPALGTRVNVVADYRSNALIVQASPTDMLEVRRMIAELDIETSAAANELRIFRLKNALATDVAPVLQDALNWQLIGSRVPLGATRTGTFGGGQTFGQQDERSRLRSAILTFMTVDAEGGKAIESGLLADVRITVDTNSNSLVVTAPSKSMNLIEALIKELDTLPNAQAQIKVFTIVNGDARALTSMLTQLLGQQTTTQATTALFGQGTVSPFLAAGMQSGAASGESALVPVRFGVDQRTNSIIATGSEGDLGVVEAILFRLDEQSLREHRTMVYWLANAPATEVATALTSWIQQRTTLFQQQLQISPESPDIQWNRRVIVVPETISNTIIISAAPELFDEVKHVVESLDRRPPLIKIDVLIAEVQLDHNLEFGTEFGLQDSLLYDRTYATTGVGAASRPGFNFNNRALGDTTTGNPSNLLGQGLSTFGVGRLSPTLGYGGLVLSASSEAVSALIRALEQQGRAQILSRPTVTTLDSQPALVNVGQITARPGEISQNVNNTIQSINDVQVGLVLGVTPRVTPDGLVIMEVDAEKSRLGDANDSVTIGDNVIRNINNVTASTTVSARSGQTVVFAGLIETTKSQDVRGIPFLSGIPVLGNLFKFTQDVEKRRELLIVLTPHVIRGEDDIDRIRMAESERMSWCLADVMALYGNVGFAAREGAWCDCETEIPLIFPDANPTGAEITPSPMPRIDENSNSGLPPPGHTSMGRIRELEPSAPLDIPPATSGPTPAQPIANTGFYGPPPAGGYPGAMLGYQGMPHGPPAPLAGPPLPGAMPMTNEPYTPARRLPQAP